MGVQRSAVGIPGAIAGVRSPIQEAWSPIDGPLIPRDVAPSTIDGARSPTRRPSRRSVRHNRVPVAGIARPAPPRTDLPPAPDAFSSSAGQDIGIILVSLLEGGA